jgi:hypothetical protein
MDGCCHNMKMPECRKNLVRGIGIFTGSQLPPSGIGIPASFVSSERARWSRISPASTSYGIKVIVLIPIP